MEQSLFLQILHQIPVYELGKKAIEQGDTPVVYHEMAETSKAHAIFGLIEDLEKSALVITYNDSQAKKIHEDLHYFFGEKVLYFPAEPTIHYFVEAYSPEVSIERLRVLEALAHRKQKIIVTSIDAVMKKMIAKEDFDKYQKNLEIGQTIEIQDLQKLLESSGYERVLEVESPGQYNIRGGIIDLYPMTSQEPYRLEFFDDEIDSIRSFDPLSQRSLEKHEKITLSPARELLLSEEVKQEAIKNFETEINKYIKSLKSKGKKESAQDIQEKLYSRLEAFKEGREKSLEFLLPYMNYTFDTLLEYLSEDSIVFLDQPHRIKEKYDHTTFELEEDFKGLLSRGEVLPNQYEIFFSYHQLTIAMEQRSLCIFQTLLRNVDPFKPKKIFSFASRSMQPFHGKIDLLVEELRHWKKRRYAVVILTENWERTKQLVKDLGDYQLTAIAKKNTQEDLQEGKIIVLPGALHRGVEYPETKVAIISEKEIFLQQQKKTKRRKKQGKRKIESFTDLNIGDYVVHEAHGIGIYLGLEKIQVEGIQKDYLHIKYGQGDKLYVPTDQMDLIQPYIGAESRAPKLNKLGGNEWKRAKGKVQKAVEDMAEELLKLYALRQTIEGYSFSKDTPWQIQFEERFPYEETLDQLQAIQEVKKDMESSTAMDRLLCGDVGYGKTEVAIRAAFKAVMDGKQVAVLVPTTILAQQHYNTMIERFSGYPISIDMLSRFRSKVEQKQTLKDIKTGMVDIVVGTHRIVQKDIQFKDLGLLIIDEEQRFGVGHKEKLKEWKKNVDVLSLSATPIPRTLHMSLVGIRDMSVIEQPPEERYPVQTYVLEDNEQLIRDAILREIHRGGQVYYVYNRVEDIDKVAHNLRTLVPESKIAIAHGQMSENELENTMMAFIEGEYDVLVCTTIIETGLDMPNVNTIIISDADRLGLSQLYQLRGRVGRSTRQAYAYITYKKDKVLTEVAEKRLQAIKEFTEFGSGFKVAMRDLEIRGAGNLLGADQHGHMAAIGYDLYCKMLDEALRKMKGLPMEKRRETSIELQVDAFIPDWYIHKESQRIQMYKKMVGMESMEDLYDVEEEIEDRFGDLPKSVRNLLMISYMKSLAQKLNIHSIQQKKNQVYLYMDKEDFVSMEIIGQLVKENGRNIMINASDEPYIALRVPSFIDKQLDKIKEILERINVLKES